MKKSLKLRVRKRRQTKKNKRPLRKRRTLNVFGGESTVGTDNSLDTALSDELSVPTDNSLNTALSDLKTFYGHPLFDNQKSKIKEFISTAQSKNPGVNSTEIQDNILDNFKSSLDSLKEAGYIGLESFYNYNGQIDDYIKNNKDPFILDFDPNPINDGCGSDCIYNGVFLEKDGKISNGQKPITPKYDDEDYYVTFPPPPLPKSGGKKSSRKSRKIRRI